MTSPAQFPDLPRSVCRSLEPAGDNRRYDTRRMVDLVIAGHGAADCLE
jgi:hypothetical protein